MSARSRGTTAHRGTPTAYCRGVLNGGLCAAWRARVATVVIVAAVAVAGVVPSAGATSIAEPDWVAATKCTSPVRPTVTLTAGGFVAYDPVYRYRYDQTLLTPTRWRSPSTTDPGFNLEAYGLMWMPQLLAAISASPDADERLDVLVSAMASTLSWRPDTGRATDPVWAEGPNLRRQENLNCLYSVTRDARLVPVMSAVAHANLDPLRYYGPPVHPPHNHGIMANLALLNASELLGRADLRTAAINRMRVAVVASFTAGGLSIEQSTSYHQAVIGKWGAVSSRLRTLGGDDALTLATSIDSILVRAKRALAFLVAPNGIPVNFGDQVAGRTAMVASSRMLFLDPAAGVLTARWSWSAPDDFVAARFGGPRQMHGHEDRMSVVWWATGRPILVDPGTATYVAGPAHDWTLLSASHSVPVVSGRPFAPKAPIAISAVRTGSIDSFTLTGRPWGVTQSRHVAVDSRLNRLTLTDTAAGRLSPVLQLDTRWWCRSISADRTLATFVDSTGARLTVRTTGRITSIKRGQPGLAGGWTFSYPPERRAAAGRIVITGGTSVVTTLQVTGAGLTPWTP